MNRSCKQYRWTILHNKDGQEWGHHRVSPFARQWLGLLLPINPSLCYNKAAYDFKSTYASAGDKESPLVIRWFKEATRSLTARRSGIMSWNQKWLQHKVLPVTLEYDPTLHAKHTESPAEMTAPSESIIPPCPFNALCTCIYGYIQFPIKIWD